ncbi:hypothetical protein JIG36_48770 [Actinoplanes sp. LDG1-06]|uniref:Uncharacterized protein n=1 Tax=Paractinoplanes ovalisporus TaxID=2810368 RepID=A0ABS2AUC1_9ACTN|nr:hypothetical protein [Actinoplanes ovalisporus]MBM2623416.1 hypothetical protein [Actinoplanes ovalisporus]
MPHRFTLQSVSGVKVLGSFDPFSYGFEFPQLHTVANVPESASDDTLRAAGTEGTTNIIPAAQALPAMQAAFQKIPTWLLVHEVAHLLQINATFAGVRNFSSLARLLKSLSAAFAESIDASGASPLRMSRDSLSGDEKPALSACHAAYLDRALALGNSLRVPRAVAEPHVVAEIPGMFWLTADLFAEGDYRWLLLPSSTFPATDGSLRVMGNAQLLEGQAWALERWREFLQNNDPDALNPVGDVPLDPYALAFGAYNTLVGQGRTSPLTASPSVEFAVIVDTALMCDGLVQPEPSYTSGHAFNYFMDLLLLIRQDPEELRLRYRDADGGYEAVAMFQDSLLRAMHMPVPSIRRLTEQLRDEYPDRIAELCASAPLIQAFAPTWHHSHDFLVGQRLGNVRGACLMPDLLFAERELVELIVLACGGGFNMAVMPVTDSGSEVAMLSRSAAMHVQSLLEELVLGREPCPARQQCSLPVRPTCGGVVDRPEVSEAGSRCSREVALLELLRHYGVERIVPSP